MKNRVLLAFVASVTACAAYAAEVTPDMAMAAADAWAERNAQFETGNNATNVITECDTNAARTVLWHQVSMAGGGSLIIAPVTEIEPVIMALDNDPGELPAAHPLRAILMGDIRKRLRFLKLYEEDVPSGGGGRRLAAGASGAQSAEAESENVAAVRQEWGEQQQTKWKGLLTPTSQPTRGGRRLKVNEKEGVANDDDMPIKIIVKGFEQGGPLTHWNQSGGIYNLYTPYNSVCGCVATAMSAMMQFFRVAETEGTKIKAGQVNSSCTYNGGPVPGGAATRGGVYDWSKFDSCTSRADYNHLSQEQKQILGTVAYDAGVAVGMNWTKGASGAIEANIATAFTEYFGFHEVRYVHEPTQDQYAKLIYAQCRANAPVGMGIEKHSVVAVGYGIDNDGVERVRVFLGWGGAGDGWYSLPYIDTKSTEGGSSYLSEIVDGLITLIGYQDDNVVPVCGQLLPPMNASVTINGKATEANDSGLFGARVSAKDSQNKQVEVVCQNGSITKSGNVTIGSDPGKDSSNMSSGGGICRWVPDSIVIPLLRSEIALSFTDARDKSIASITNGTPKPVLAFSGDWNDHAPTAAAWNYLSEMDDQNINDFTNKYVILCTPYGLGSLSESDGNPSIGIFDGRAISADVNKVWSFYNGRLAHWSIGGLIYTNVEDQVDNDIREFYVTNSVDGAKFIVTNSVEELSAHDANIFEKDGNVPARFITGWGITNYVQEIMDKGRTNFLVRVADISVTISNACPEACYPLPSPNYGTQPPMSNGVSFVSTVPEFTTNAAENIEYKCLGCIYSWTNKTDGTTWVETNNNVTAHTIDVTIKDVDYTITWYWEVSKVKITTESVDDNDTFDTVVPGTGWHQVGSLVTFKATPPPKSQGCDAYFANWVIVPYGSQNLNDGDMSSQFGEDLAVFVERPITVRAQFAREFTPPDWGSFNLVITNVCLKLEGGIGTSTDTVEARVAMEMSEIVSGTALTNGEIVATVAPKTQYKGSALENNATNVIQKLGIASMELATDTITGTDSQSYVCCGWIVTKRMLNDKGTAFIEKALDIVYSSEGYVATIDDLLAEQPGLEINYALTPTVAGIRTGNPIYEYKYPVEDGDTLTLTWIWKRGTGDGVSKFYDIQWNDGLDNLKPNESVDLLLTAAMDAKGWTTDDLVVTAPTGWIATVVNAGGMVSAQLQRDDAALSSAMETCTLTVYSNDDGTGTYTVQADITEALRGFYYVLYGSDDLVNWDVITSGYESGTSAAQAQGTAANPVGPVTLYITVTPSGAGAKRFYKVVSGATATPLTTY